MERRVIAVYFPMLSVDLIRQSLIKESSIKENLLKEGLRNSSPENRGKTEKDKLAIKDLPPIILTTPFRGKDIVTRCCENARKYEVRSGMNLADARALAGDALVLPFRSDLEAHAVKQFALWSYRFSPLAAPEPVTDLRDPRGNGIVIDITGCARLFKGEENLLTTLSREISRFAIRSRIALTPTWGASWALSRYGASQRILLPSSRESIIHAITPLPISALRISREVRTKLHEVNLQTVGDLLAFRSRHALFSRFGKELLDRLDQITGDLDEPVTPLTAPPLFVVERRFDSPITDREQLKYLLKIVIGELLKKLRNRVSWSFTLWLRCTDRSSATKEILLSSPSESAEHLYELLAPHCDRFTLTTGVDILRLSTSETAPQGASPLSYLTEDPAHSYSTKKLGEILDRLYAELGEEGVKMIRLTPSHIPERSFVIGRSFVIERSSSLLLQSSLRSEVGLPPAERPSILLPTPEKIQALAVVPDRPPFSLQWRKKRYRVRNGIGPERIAGEWWSANPDKKREYFKVQIETGSWLWVFREMETGQWFIHGIWG